MLHVYKSLHSLRILCSLYSTYIRIYFLCIYVLRIYIYIHYILRIFYVLYYVSTEDKNAYSSIILQIYKYTKYTKHKYIPPTRKKKTQKTKYAVLEITTGHWPFSNQFQHLVDQIHFGWPNLLYILMGRPSVTHKMSYLQKNS